MGGEKKLGDASAHVPRLLAGVLDKLAKELGRKPRVYVIGHKERSKEDTKRLIQSADVCLMKNAWEAIDDRARYEWVNE